MRCSPQFRAAVSERFFAWLAGLTTPPLHEGCEEYVTLWVEYSLYPYSGRSSSFQHVGPFITCSKAFVLHNIGIVHDLNGVFFFHALIPCHLTHFPARLHSFAPETYGDVAGPDTQAL
jgi:hypothetical protein